MMNFKYSICYPDQEEIVFKNDSISKSDALKIAKDFPWKEQLELAENSDQNKIYYSPSLDFVNLQNGRSLGLTAVYNKQKNIEFSLWYNRPKKVKVFFGLFGETEKFIVDDVWSFNFQESINYLEQFLTGNYQIIENLYKK